MHIGFEVSTQCYRSGALPAILLLLSVAGGCGQFRPVLAASRAAPPERVRPLSTDRPDATESPFTVEAGRLQVEMSLVDFNLVRGGGATPEVATLAVAPLLLKVGLSGSADLQLGLDPFVRERTRDPASGATATVEGFGDTVLRLKLNLWGNDDGPTAFALMPFLKLPTAGRGLGNGEVEGGLIAPLALQLPNEFSLGLMAEADLVRAGAGDGYVVDLVHTATVSRRLCGDLGGFLEYAGIVALSGEEDYRGYANAGLTFGLSADTQLDGGIRVGLTGAADDLGLFLGISRRF